MNAAEFNAAHPVGTPVVAYPGARPEDCPNDERLVTRTRSKAEVLGGHTDVVWVDGHDSCIALSHVDVLTEAAWAKARFDRDATIVARRAALLTAIQAQPSGEWTSERAWMTLRRAGFQHWSHSIASGDLQALADEGHLVAHTEVVVRGYGLANSGAEVAS